MLLFFWTEIGFTITQEYILNVVGQETSTSEIWILIQLGEYVQDIHISKMYLLEYARCLYL